ncbi:hypothetical protein CJ424_02565 [Vibrio vulnificus]|uniref:Uncharacterized protein n=1 Tax=Vibrio vulnificus TaxID=672 RepID=A0A2S3R124_VIBVL|nr:hypothetical protein BWZ32_17870 [Vibrio vulnificus]MBH9743241.1 hypothetical protein [Vibrio vulnificus]MBH9763402.1 hypothetical protein [Vibrio vulnificus]MBH9771645.1 hypothetical protein [Vibrio vulnificus]MBH9779761.1 hypothetical protein [Vibrio vulnificus]
MRKIWIASGPRANAHYAVIPFLLEAAAVLAAFVHPNHIAYLCSWGFTHLPPTCNFKLFGYKRDSLIR